MDRWELEKEIILHALKNPSFKKKLESDPKGALKELFKNKNDIDLALLEKLNITVHHEKEGEFCICVPHLQNGKESERWSDEELEKIAGGCYTGTCLWQSNIP